MKGKNPTTKRITNRRAWHDYELGDSLSVGIQLTGAETKALRMGHGQLRGAYVTIKDSAKGDGELWLINAAITPLRGLVIEDSQQTRNRKLLAKRKEIDKLISAKQQGATIVPTEMIVGGRYIKLRIAVGRGKKLYDKRQTLKARDEKRKIDSVIKSQL